MLVIPMEFYSAIIRSTTYSERMCSAFCHRNLAAIQVDEARGRYRCMPHNFIVCERLHLSATVTHKALTEGNDVSSCLRGSNHLLCQHSSAAG